MSTSTLEKRVAALEGELAELKAKVIEATTKDWRRTIGMFTGDEVMKRIFEEALKYREADREKARRRYGKRQHTKK